jgi:hypothetical protein
VCRKHDAHSFATYVRRDAATHDLLRQQTHRPARAPVRNRTAHQRDDRGLLCAVELGTSTRSSFFPERVLDAVCEVPLGNPRDLASVRAQRRGGCTDRHRSVQHQQHLDPLPHPRRQLALRLSTLQVAPLSRLQLQPLEPPLLRHSCCRSKLDPTRKGDFDQNPAVTALVLAADEGPQSLRRRVVLRGPATL